MDINEYKVPKILFIRGVFIKDCIPIDDIFERQIIERLNTNNPTVKYEPLPSIFYDVKTWVKKTKIKCWYCDLHFDRMPVFIPKTVEKSRISKKHIMSVKGCFCSFSCAATYNDIHNPKVCDNRSFDEKLRFLYKLFNGTFIYDILRSPDKYTMTQYGGDIDPMTYRHSINELIKKMESF